MQIGIQSNTGSTPAYLAGYYGISGSRSNSILFATNEEHLSTVMDQLSILGDVPTVLYADLNVEPDQSTLFQTALATGEWSDPIQIHRQEVSTTFFNEAKGKPWNASTVGPSRIDAFLLNKRMSFALRHYEHDWEHLLTQHVPLLAIFQLKTLVQDLPTHRKPVQIDLKQINEPNEVDAFHLASDIVQSYATTIDKAVDEGDTETLYSIFHQTSLLYLQACLPDTHPQKSKPTHSFRKATIPKVVNSPPPKTDFLGDFQAVKPLSLSQTRARELLFLLTRHEDPNVQLNRQQHEAVISLRLQLARDNYRFFGDTSPQNVCSFEFLCVCRI